MTSVIGKNPNLASKGIFPARSTLPRYRQLIGDCSHLYSNPFVTEWTVAGDAAARTITLPLVSGYNYNCVVDWGDGTTKSLVTAYNDANRIHTYASDGTYNVKIYGVCQGWSFNNGGDKNKVTDIINWGNKPTFGGFAYLFGGFYGCSNLASLGPIDGQIPDDGLLNASRCFQSSGVSGSIPQKLLQQLTSVTDLSRLLQGCSNLTGSFPSGFFDYNTALTTLRVAVADCTGITGALPTGLLDNNTLITDAAQMFLRCDNISGYGADLLRPLTNCLDFSRFMEGCSKVQQRSDTFYRSGEETTRFLNQDVNFTSCFDRDSFTGTQGTAPDLWNCSFGTGTPTTTDCWEGAGNSAASLTNYASIPAGWL